MYLILASSLHRPLLIVLANGSTENANQYRLFELEIEVSGGVSPYGFTATGLPTGFSLEVNDDADGADIIGVTSQTGTFSVTIDVTDSDEGNVTNDSVTFDIEVASADANTIEIDVPDVYELTDGTVNELYPSLQFSTTDDAIEDRYTWSVSSGDLPNGMALSSG